jgi:hypothetical protein
MAVSLMEFNRRRGELQIGVLDSTPAERSRSRSKQQRRDFSEFFRR